MAQADPASGKGMPDWESWALVLDTDAVLSIGRLRALWTDAVDRHRGIVTRPFAEAVESRRLTLLAGEQGRYLKDPPIETGRGRRPRPKRRKRTG